MILIISGPQGSGKGTQAKMIANEFNLFHMQSGEMLREIAKTEKRIGELQNQGILVPDKETIDYMDKYIKGNKPDFDDIIFDGYPRNIDQYNLMKTWLSSKNKKVNKVIYLQISDDEAIKRLSTRRTCKNCGELYNLITRPPINSESCNKCGSKLIQRDDDKPDAIKKRLSFFHKLTEPMLKEMDAEKLLIKIDGERPVETIFQDIDSKIKNAG
jgi:adenylate kinase